MSTPIASAQNPVYKELLKLLKPKNMREQGHCLVGGEKLIRELLRDNFDQCEQLIFSDQSVDRIETFSVRLARKALVISEVLFNELDQVGTGSPLLLYNFHKNWRASASHPTGYELTPELRAQLQTQSFILSAVGDPGNMGAMIRSAAAFGVTNIMLLQEGAYPFSQKVIKASAGTVFKGTIWRGPSISKIMEELPINTMNLVTLDLAGVSLNDFSWPRPFHLLVGEEGQGLPENLTAHRIHIPMQNQVESLNAAVAISLALFSAT